MAAGKTLGERLKRVPLTRPRVRHARVEEALWQHLSAIGAETHDFLWAPDVEEGFELVRERLLADHATWAPSTSPQSWGRFSLWSPDAEISYPHRRLDRREDPLVAPVLRVARASLGRRWRVHRTSRTHRRWRQSYKQVPDPASVYRLALAAADEQAIARNRKPTRDQFPEQPRHERGWSARWNAEHKWKRELRTFESARYRATVLEPLARAWIDGLYCFWVTESPRWRQRHCILVPRPALHIAGGRLHRTDGRPAIEWPSGLSYWFWEGLHLPRRIAAKHSERTRLQVLLRTPNLERRRLLLDRIGYERFLDIADASLFQQDDYGKLWRTALSVDAEQLSVVEVVNSTPEPDGSHRRYFLRVPPDTGTAREAVAWSFGFEQASEYRLALQT